MLQANDWFEHNMSLAFDGKLSRNVAAILGAWLLFVSDLQACPMCKTALESDDPNPRAYMYSILFLLGFACVTGVGVVALLWKMNRYEKQQLEDAGYQHIFHNAVTAGQTPVPAKS